jgi:hypothetical protein
MTYTREWDDIGLNLPGTRDSDEIDDASREAKVDLEERFSDIVKDVRADPWEAKPLNTVTRIHYSAGFHVSSMIETVTTVDIGFPYISPVLANGSLTILVPIPVPVGQILSKVRVRAKLYNAGSILVASVKRVDASGLSTQLGIASVTGVVNTTFTDFDTSTSPTLAGVDDVFYVNVDLQNPATPGVNISFLDVEVTLNTPT